MHAHYQSSGETRYNTCSPADGACMLHVSRRVSWSLKYSISTQYGQPDCRGLESLSTAGVLAGG